MYNSFAEDSDKGRPAGSKSLPSDLPFSEQMRAVIAYKTRGQWPFPNMLRGTKNDFRRRAKQFTLLDSGELMKIDKKEGVPTGILGKIH